MFPFFPPVHLIWSPICQDGGRREEKKSNKNRLTWQQSKYSYLKFGGLLMVATRLLDAKMRPLPRFDPVLQKSHACLSFAVCKRTVPFYRGTSARTEQHKHPTWSARAHIQTVSCSFPVPHRVMICCVVRLTSLLCHKHPLSVCDNEWLMYRQMQLNIMALLLIFDRHTN